MFGFEESDPIDESQILSKNRADYQIFLNVLNELATSSWRDCAYSHTLKHQTMETVFDICPPKLSQSIFENLAQIFRRQIESNSIFGVHGETKEYEQVAIKTANFERMVTIEELYSLNPDCQNSNVSRKIPTTDGDMNVKSHEICTPKICTPKKQKVSTLPESVLEDYASVVEGIEKLHTVKKRKRETSCETVMQILECKSQHITDDFPMIAPKTPTTSAKKIRYTNSPTDDASRPLPKYAKLQNHPLRGDVKDVINSFVNSDDEFDTEYHAETLRKYTLLKQFRSDNTVLLSSNSEAKKTSIGNIFESVHCWNTIKTLIHGDHFLKKSYCIPVSRIVLNICCVDHSVIPTFALLSGEDDFDRMQAAFTQLPVELLICLNRRMKPLESILAEETTKLRRPMTDAERSHLQVEYQREHVRESTVKGIYINCFSEFLSSRISSVRFEYDEQRLFETMIELSIEYYENAMPHVCFYILKIFVELIHEFGTSKMDQLANKYLSDSGNLGFHILNNWIDGQHATENLERSELLLKSDYIVDRVSKYYTSPIGEGKSINNKYSSKQLLILSKISSMIEVSPYLRDEKAKQNIVKLWKLIDMSKIDLNLVKNKDEKETNLETELFYQMLSMLRNISNSHPYLVEMRDLKIMVQYLTGNSSFSVFNETSGREPESIDAIFETIKNVSVESKNNQFNFFEELEMFKTINKLSLFIDPSCKPSHKSVRINKSQRKMFECVLELIGLYLQSNKPTTAIREILKSLDPYIANLPRKYEILYHELPKNSKPTQHTIVVVSESGTVDEDDDKENCLAQPIKKHSTRTTGTIEID